jgi:hypothetical protein
MKSKLGILRSQLHRLQRKRAFVRWGSAACALSMILLWSLATAFLGDWSFHLAREWRMAVLAGWIAIGLLALKSIIWPLLFMRETIEDMALIVETRNKIDSDLVAALQFENPPASTWGSKRLADAVVDYVAEFSPSLNVFEGFSYRPLPKRAMGLLATLAIIGGIVFAFPEHASAFWNRFLLGKGHYPTKTQIESIMVSEQEVPVFADRPIDPVRIPYGQPIKFEVKCSGIVPEAGSASLSGIHNDSSNRVDLSRVSGQSDKFVGEMTHLTDSFKVRFAFGDAISDPVEVVIVPLPLVDVAWEVIPPAYASTSLKPGEFEAGARQFSVLEGASAKLKLTCSNKPLRSVQLTSSDITYDLVASTTDPGRQAIWSLPPDTPFDSIREGLKYEIQVIDRDNLSLENPITGQVRLKPDRSPRIVASAVTRQVLPTAQPKLDFVAGDDFGVARIVAVINISREDGQMSRHEVVAKVVSESEQPVTIVRGQIAIPLSKFELVKGDEVKVGLEVTDWRGAAEGQKGYGEPTTLTVTDLNGIFAQTGEEDKKSAKQLDEILRRELGIGGEKK